MMGAMAVEMICIPNRKKMTMKLIQPRLKNIMESKVMKKHNNLPVQKIKNVQ